MRAQTTNGLIAVVSTSLVLASCGFRSGLEAGSVSQTTYGAAQKFSKVDINSQPLDKTVCDPFEGNPAESMDQGIRATLHYLTSGMARLYKSEDYVSLAKKSDQKLFFSDLNVPTRMFSEGFATQTNDVVKDDLGTKLIEYFGIKFETVLKLGPNDDEGDYELALLSDDGTTLKIVSGKPDSPVYTTLIDNDGDHETRMGCAKQTVRMTQDDSLPIQLTYYQGPRFHIANVLLWRKADVAGKDAECGKAGNSYFFNPNNGSAPLQPYKNLLARGWKVVGKENFFIPKNETYNPCVAGTNPVISNFRVDETTQSMVFLSWTTDIPASSQVKLVNKATGEVILTESDNALRTVHSVSVSGLQSGAVYTAQAVSVSEDLGHTLSEIIEVFTN